MAQILKTNIQSMIYEFFNNRANFLECDFKALRSLDSISSFLPTFADKSSDFQDSINSKDSINSSVNSHLSLLKANKTSKHFMPKIFICSNDEIELCRHAINFLLGDLNPLAITLPDIRLSPLSNTQSFYEEFHSLFAKLAQWYESGCEDILITTPHTIMNFLPSPALLSSFTLKLEQDIAPDVIVNRLLNHGYERVEIVEMQGEFSLRGDVLDIFVPDSQSPVRLSFFDTLIESIRYFDLQTQLSDKTELKSIKITPAMFSLDSQSKEIIESKIEKMCENGEILREEKSVNNFAFWFLKDICVKSQNLDSDESKEVCDFAEQDSKNSTHLSSGGIDFLRKYPHIFSPAALREYMENLEFIASRLIPDDDTCFRVLNFRIDSKDMDFITHNNLAGTIKLNATKQIYILSKSDAMIKAISENLMGVISPRPLISLEKNSHLESQSPALASPLKNSHIKNTSLKNDPSHSHGLRFIITPHYFNIITKDSIFISLEQFQKNVRKRVRLELHSLKTGEYVVHNEYGVGIFECIKQVEVARAKQDFISIIYANDDRLLLPVTNINFIEKYSSYDSVIKLDRLGKGSFAKLKDSIKQKLLEIANEIVRVQAQRDLSEGLKISLDSTESLVAYKRFESKRGFELTSDQQNAIEESLKDFKSGKVMDRLLNGDVGFGKSEVAMSLSYVTALNGYVSLILVPTTLLCNQHFDSFSERLNGLFLHNNKCVKVAKVDRFSTIKQKNALQDSIKSGDVQIIIGTHTLFNLDIQNLGFIVIDEEHKFGVEQKEIFKQKGLKTHILMMSATPIPRTLNMAYSKIKSISVINTPPFFKQDSKTFVKLKSDSLLKEVIARELRRAGQVFYIFNNIAKIGTIKNYLLGLMPRLKILTLHSKINPKDMESGMLDFLHKKYDVLLCTSIVESGIHLPNANTIIIDDAHNFGIADLHQLRGRVGRGKSVGYCYLLTKENIAENSAKRLLALEKNSYLGSGASIAYHDLEIRGGGNLLGAAQSGHIKQVGFSMYVRLLEESLQDLTQSGAESINGKKVDLKLSVSGFLNDMLITSEQMRLELYRRLSRAKSEAQVRRIESEIEERFGKLDIYSLQFLELVIIKILALNKGIKAISNAGNNIAITKNDDTKIYLKAQTRDDDDVLMCVKKWLKEISV